MSPLTAEASVQQANSSSSTSSPSPESSLPSRAQERDETSLENVELSNEAQTARDSKLETIEESTSLGGGAGFQEAAKEQSVGDAASGEGTESSEKGQGKEKAKAEDRFNCCIWFVLIFAPF